MKTNLIMAAGVDGKSLGLCMMSIFLKIVSDVTLSDLATASAALAGFTTVIYNLQKIYKNSKKD